VSVRADVIVIGGGVNGLVAATQIARAFRGGCRVTLVEATDRLGGLTAVEEFCPGYRAPRVFDDTSLFRAMLARNLDLPRFGWSTRSGSRRTLALDGASNGVVVAADPEPGAGPDHADAQAYDGFLRFIARLSGPVSGLLNAPPPALDGKGPATIFELLRHAPSLVTVRRKDLLELARVAPMAIADWLEERFTNPVLRGCLATEALFGVFGGPRSPGTTLPFLLNRFAGGPETTGGSRVLVQALEAVARHAGVDVITDTKVTKIEVDGEHPVVHLLGRGQSIDEGAMTARAIVSCLDPRSTFLRLVSPTRLPVALVDRVEAFRVRGTMSRLFVALDGPPSFAATRDERIEWVRAGHDLDTLERAFDGVKHGRASERPMLTVHVPTFSDPSLAPAGHHVLSVTAQHAPFELDDASRQAFERSILNVLEELCPGVTGRVVGQRLLTPADLEDRFGLSGGHVLHGEHALDQLFSLRPNRRCSRHRTPVTGLYLGGSGTHPGGGPTGVPGYLAAKAVVQDLRR